VKLYWHPFSIMPWRIRIALREKRLAAEEVLVDVTTSGTRKPEFLRLNPFGQIPVLEDGALTISESMAILEYLEERYPEPALLPRELPLRARARELMCWSTDYWPPAWKKWMAPRPARCAVDRGFDRRGTARARGTPRRARSEPRAPGLARWQLLARGHLLRAARARAGSRRSGRGSHEASGHRAMGTTLARSSRRAGLDDAAGAADGTPALTPDARRAKLKPIAAFP
jgi:Glutathione S-transferase, N-terminal domain